MKMSAGKSDLDLNHPFADRCLPACTTTKCCVHLRGYASLSNMPKIYLYAEILTHIRQLSLHASLQTAKAEGTKVDVSTDKKVITVVHDGETQKLYLPTQISGTAQVIFPIAKDTEISARVQIDDEHEWKCLISNEIEAPWMATDLTKKSAIQCRQCGTPLLAADVIDQWKNLPSENWAELMDFWFCHKPHDEAQDDADDAARAKGYSSQSKLGVTHGTGMTDLTSIVLHQSDCRNVKVSIEPCHQPYATGEKKETFLVQSGPVSDTLAEH